MTSANPLLSNNERQILLSLIDRIEIECCTNNKSALSLDSSPSRSSTETISLSHNCRLHSRNGSLTDSCVNCLPDSYQTALSAHNEMTTKTYGSALLSAPDMLSYDSNLQSVVASVSTVQATDTTGMKSGDAKPMKTAPSLASENNTSGINERVNQLPRKRLTARAKRRKVRAVDDSQASWKRELFSQFLCSGLSEEDQRENLLCLLKAANNRSFCIRGDQRRKFIDLQLAAKRREAPVRVNRTTQLRMQQVDDARQWEQRQANRFNRHLNTGYQRQLQLKRRRLLKKQREEQQEQKLWQPAQRNRNAAITGQTHSLSTVTSPSSSLDKRATVLRRRRRRKGKSVDSSDSDISLTFLTVALDDTRGQSSANQRQRHQENGQRKLLPKKAAAPTHQVLRETTSGASDATKMTVTGFTTTTTTTETSSTSTTATTSGTSTLLEDCSEVGDTLSISAGQPLALKADKKVEKSLLYATGSEAKGKSLDKCGGGVSKKISSSSTNTSDLNTPPTPKPRQHRREGEQGKNSPDFDMLQRRMAERQRETNNLGETDLLTTTCSTDALEKLRENFLQGVERRLFNSAGGSSSQSVASGDSIGGSSWKDSIGGRLYSEFSHLRTDLSELLELKKMTLKADLSPATQAELLNENQQRLSTKVRQLDALIQRVRAHLDAHSESNSSSDVPQRKATGKAAGGTFSYVEHHNEAEMVAQALDDVKQKFAQMIGLDISVNSASEMSSIRVENPECLKLMDSNSEEPMPNSWSKVCCHEKLVRFKCAPPVHNQAISTDTAVNINAAGNCQHDQQPCEQDAEEQTEEVNDSEEFNNCEQHVWSLKPSEKDAHAMRIVNQMRQQLDIMRNAGDRVKSLGDPLATLDRCRRASRQRAIERDPSEARLVPVILRYRKWPPGSSQFLAFQSNRCNWCKRYSEAVLPQWTKTIRVDLSLHEPIDQSLLLLAIRLGKPLSPDWLLSTNAFPDDSCAGNAQIIDLLKTPKNAGLKPWQTVFISETDTISRLVEAAELIQVKLREAKNNTASADDESAPVGLSEIGTMTASPAYVSPTSLDAGTVTACAKQAVLASERVAATAATGLLSASVLVDDKKSEEPSFNSTCKFSSAANVNTYGNVKAENGRSAGVRVSGDISKGDSPSTSQTLSILNTSSIAGDCDSGQRAHLARNYVAKNMCDSNHHHQTAPPCGWRSLNGGLYSMDKGTEDSEPSDCNASLQSSVR